MIVVGSQIRQGVERQGEEGGATGGYSSVSDSQARRNTRSLLSLPIRHGL